MDSRVAKVGLPSNELHALRVVPPQFLHLCQKILAFQLQHPTNLQVSVKGLHTWNPNCCFPDLSTNAHKSWTIRTLLNSAPVLLQETKSAVSTAHSWPDIRVAAIAKFDPCAQAGVAILVPPGWIPTEEKVLAPRHVTAACVSHQACSKSQAHG